MKRFAILVASLLFSQTALAGPNWQVGTFSMEASNLEVLLAASDEFMKSAIGKELPGTVSLMVNVIDGSSPATHSFITAFDSMAARESWFQKAQGDPAWTEFVKAFTPISEPVSNSRMAFMKRWGTQSDKDVVWRIHLFDVKDTGDFTKALDELMASESAKKFPGSLHLSAVSAAGTTSTTHVVSVGYESEAEAEAWTDKLITSDDWEDYLDDSQDAADFQGTFVIRTVKTWGDLDLE